VRLVWVCRSHADSSIFEESLKEINMAQFSSPVSNINGGPTFTASVHVTGTGNSIISYIIILIILITIV
jgi:hypothetical protein